MLVNSTRDKAALRHTTSHSGRLLVADCTALALDLTHTLAGLSTAMGIAAAHLVGLPLADSLAGLAEELDEAHLDPAQRQANLQLAQATYALVRSWEPIQEDGGEAVVPATPLVEVLFDPPQRRPRAFMPWPTARRARPAVGDSSGRYSTRNAVPAAGSASCAVRKRRLP